MSPRIRHLDMDRTQCIHLQQRNGPPPIPKPTSARIPTIEITGSSHGHWNTPLINERLGSLETSTMDGATTPHSNINSALLGCSAGHHPLHEIPGKNKVVEFGNMQTSGASVLVHAIIYFGLITIFCLAIGVHIYASQ
ncbi:hypothetical protein Goshw_003504 [Gossypium schwendimanii]|uniref:Uncharacterized protein n=1 Tax=Gossypium schwendimanii TaxID=34291 RepID=A0A7J9NDN3_GOSSC|nr:hypothetical protein [Gossypium schwendimanii]